MKDSSDVHVGTRNQYNAPVTVQKYITVNNEIQGFTFVPNFSVTQPSHSSRHILAKTHPALTEPTIPLEEHNYHTHNLNDSNDLQKEPCKSLGGLFPKCGNMSTAICWNCDSINTVTVLVYYLGAETSNTSEENSLSFTVQTSHGNDSVDVGTAYVFF